MDNKFSGLEESINTFTGKLGIKNPPIIKKFFIGKDGITKAAIIYMDGIINKDIIDRDILKPLMVNIEEDISNYEEVSNYLCERYIYMSNTYVEKDIDKVVDSIKRGKTAIIINDVLDFIIVDTTGGNVRDIGEPKNESSIRGSREGFVENLETNLSILKRIIRDNNLSIETLTAGRRSKTDVAIVYINDIADKDIVNDIRTRISEIDVDVILEIGVIEQLIEKHTYTLFPQALTTERPDRVVANIMEGRLAIMIGGTPFAIILPVMFTDFFQGIEDYYERTVISSFIRSLRIISVFLVITLPSIYLVFIRFNAELIPLKAVIPIIQSRKGVAFPPILEIISMEIVLEFLREGGLRLPNKIGQTLSVVGGFIIGDAAIRARVVSPTTIVVVGVAAIGTFVIPNYEMSLSIRLLRFPMLIISNSLGVLGIAAGWYIIMVHLHSLDSFGVPYLFTNKYADIKDILVRVPLWQMNKRPESIPNNDPIRQTDFRKKFRRKDNEKGK